MPLKLIIKNFLYKILPSSVKTYLSYVPATAGQLRQQYVLNRMQISLQKGSLGAALRIIDFTNPETWEFSAFSQNGEDGILDVLISKLKRTDRFFIELGCGSTLENNTTFLALVKRFRGLMVDADKSGIETGRYLLDGPCVERVKFSHAFITLDSIGQILKNGSQEKVPDVFSLDIDGNDFHIAKRVFELGLRPKIFVVEYNAHFGSDAAVTVPYSEESFYTTNKVSRGEYGCSLKGWEELFERQGYKLVAVECEGVNAFFVAPEYFEDTFLQALKKPFYRPSRYINGKVFPLNEQGIPRTPTNMPLENVLNHL